MVYEVGDGQQRLIHTSLILAGIAYTLREISEDSRIDERQKGQLESTFYGILPEKGNRKPGNLAFVREGEVLPRIIVAPSNQMVYTSIISWNLDSLDDKHKGSLLFEAFNYYKHQINNLLSPLPFEEIDEKSSAIIDSILDHLIFATAYFSVNEDMQASYETTNSKSIPLTESELIKNLIFKNFELSDQKKLVKNYWEDFDTDYWIDKIRVLKAIEGRYYPKKQDVLDTIFWLHTTALTGKTVHKSVSETHPIFSAFKSCHENILISLKKDDDKDYRRTYYENTLKTIHDFAMFYKRILEHENPHEQKISVVSDDYRWWEFFYRLEKGCQVKDSMILSFALKLRMNLKHSDSAHLDWNSTKEIMDMIESFAIRKTLVGLNPSDTVDIFLRMIHDGKNATQIRSELSAFSFKKNAWEGDENIFINQKYSQWSANNRLAIILNVDYENEESNIIDKFSERKTYNGQTLEHFMPQNSKNPDEEWPLENPDRAIRSRLIYNFGNFLILPPSINSSLGNRSRKEKLDVLKQSLNTSGSFGVVSLDAAFNADKWQEEEILAECDKKLQVVLRKYSGPRKTMKNYAFSYYVASGSIQPGEKLYFHSKTGDLIHIEITEDGRAKFEGNYYEQIKDLILAIDPNVNLKLSKKLLSLEKNQKLVSLLEFEKQFN